MKISTSAKDKNIKKKKKKKKSKGKTELNETIIPLVTITKT